MFSKKDLRLLYELDSHYRQPYSQIGKKLRMSQQLISHKVKQFHKKGIITGHCPLIDYSRFGLLTFIVFFKVHYHNEASFAKLIEQMKTQENITGIIECDGKYDLAVIFAAKNPSSFNKKLKSFVSENPALRDWTILTTVVEHWYPRNYLVNKEGTHDVIIGGDREELPVDELDKNIIAALTEGKKRVVDISQATGTTPKTVLARIKNLEKKQIIRGYRLVLNPRALGIATNVLLIKYRNITGEREEEFRSFCKYNPHIVEFTKTFGEWDALLHMETRDRAEFRKLSLQLREKFNDIIVEVDNFRVFSVPKRQLFPKDS